ncbi:poly [ADP-ribose] polymerase isoform X1 [Drosophila bipectinata]|uniref:poly [ADP-ribose] polymerase isoform X1 n=2 Tax=Drosophila bipectinata TaxID=42026 RepID=UPI001C8935D6|nr:poly [ADP-ribose] polymerase isoform X1 [Drosophila bipectinata]
MDVELPFMAEYARTGRASCKGCKSNIAKDNLRIAVMVQSAFHDSKIPNWFHKSCFFQKQRPTSVGDIQNYENLRFVDQKDLADSIGNLEQICETNSKKKRKGDSGPLKDFGMEYAKSGRASCRGCEQKISKDTIRIRKTVYDTEVGMKYGGQPLWHHLECFAQLRTELGWLACGDNMTGFSNLKSEDQHDVKRVLPKIKSEELPPTKKIKMETTEDNKDQKIIKQLENENVTLFMYRDKLKSEVKRIDIESLLITNNQEPITGNTEKLLDQAADLLTFGSIEPCPECGGSQFIFNKFGYLCNGNTTEWTKCAHLLKKPTRMACKIPDVLKNMYSFLDSVQETPKNRTIQYIPPSESTISRNLTVKTANETLDGPKVIRKKPTLYNLTFSHVGMKHKENDLKTRIQKLGGKFETKISESTIAIISTENEVKRNSQRMLTAQKFGIHVVPIEYLDVVESDADGAINYINSLSLCNWGSDLSKKVPQDEVKSLRSNSIYTKSAPKSKTLKIKNGMAVDPESGLEDIAHVYARGKDNYNAVLGLTDIQRNKNSYYKLQLLEADKKSKYWIFRSWGRIGTTIGNSKLEEFGSIAEAINTFKKVYVDKTGNDFEKRNQFVKMAGRMYPIDVQYEEHSSISNHSDYSLKSNLEPSVQNLIKLIFDVDSMKSALLEFHIDLEKMPLGKLSLQQVQSAYTVAANIFDLIKSGSTTAKLVDASNRFYTLIPHNFGVKSPPIIETIEQVESLVHMLDSLAEIEVAYSFIKTEDLSDNKHPLDKHYSQLKTNLEPLDKNSEEFSILKDYVKNTHASTHASYVLEVVDVFKVARQGEARRYKPFKKLHNRKLLWHGSRLTNFAGILSHGLKIAPPEAPPTGYMFGKGIYFADMVSKSANYCCTSQKNCTGLMLLSEVALGDMMELTSAKYITKLPKNKHSCFGRGRTMPNPKESFIRKDGVEIPIGKAVTNENLKSSLLYNEYIVYDIAQVNVQYLFRMEFKYKY